MALGYERPKRCSVNSLTIKYALPRTFCAEELNELEAWLSETDRFPALPVNWSFEGRAERLQ
jgi:hypothetical protein